MYFIFILLYVYNLYPGQAKVEELNKKDLVLLAQTIDPPSYKEANDLLDKGQIKEAIAILETSWPVITLILTRK